MRMTMISWVVVMAPPMHWADEATSAASSRCWAQIEGRGKPATLVSGSGMVLKRFPVSVPPHYARLTRLSGPRGAQIDISRQNA
jgi:hypothetical protein